MRYGVFSGVLWGLDTVVLGAALALAPFLGAGRASLAGAALHDAVCALILLVYMTARGAWATPWPRSGRARAWPSWSGPCSAGRSA